MLIKETGTFRGVVLEHGVSLSSGGCPQFCAKLQAVEMYNWDTKEWENYSGHEDTEITAYLTLFTAESKPIFHVDAVMKVFEWDGASLAELDQKDLNGVGVQFNVVEHEYDGKVSMQVANISGFEDAPNTGSGVKKVDAKTLKDIDAKFGAALQKLSGGPKAATAPKKTTKKTTKKTAPKPVVKEENPIKELEAEAAADEAKESKPAVPAPPSKPKTQPKSGMTKDEAWEHCYNMKAKTVTDEQLTKAFLTSIEKIGGGVDDDALLPEQWAQVAENVVAEYGVF